MSTIIDRSTLQSAIWNDLSYLFDSPDEVQEIHLRTTSDYGLDRHKVRAARLITELNRKQESKEVSEEHITASILALRSNESDCASVNSSRPWLATTWWPTAKDLVFRMLGDTPNPEDYERLCRFGPGATVSHKGPMGRVLLSKIEGVQTVSKRALPFAGAIASSCFPHWYDSVLAGSKCHITDVNRISFVPKDVRKCRQIAIEPSLNMFLQLGVGEFISRRLRRVGVNLRDQSHNHRSISDWRSSATIDLSDASSRIPSQLVKDLFPSEWWILLNSLRSHGGVLPDGSKLRYHSFSTQGNGFTFPVETVVFWSVLRAAIGNSLLAVYGDDIVVKRSEYQRAIDALTTINGRVNLEKSFGSGPFRETCGLDTYEGFNIRPVYYRADAELYHDVASLHNRLRRWGFLDGSETLNYLRGLVPKEKRCFGPEAVWTSREDRTVNTLAEVDYQWFADANPLIWTHTAYGYRSILPKKYLRGKSEYARYLAFLYTGRSDLSSLSPITRPITRKLKNYAGAVPLREPEGLPLWSSD